MSGDSRIQICLSSFYRILKEAMDKNLVSGTQVFIDSTHVKASASKRKYDKKVVQKEVRVYQTRLFDEINGDREGRGKKHFHPIN